VDDVYYVSLSLLIMKVLLQAIKGWRGVEDGLKHLPGEHFDITQVIIIIIMVIIIMIIIMMIIIKLDQ
jgi:hypothetical protein